ncbi:MAG: hypothetical protein D3908_12680 [Candidatus Electrothrix sp. AUS4]|nr:hypothetical protein [Candidatus Electrothrix sp. AUS4]
MYKNKIPCGAFCSRFFLSSLSVDEVGGKGWAFFVCKRRISGAWETGIRKAACAGSRGEDLLWRFRFFDDTEEVSV